MSTSAERIPIYDAEHFCEVAKSGDLLQVQRLHNHQGSDIVNAKGYYYQTALHDACAITEFNVLRRGGNGIALAHGGWKLCGRRSRGFGGGTFFGGLVGLRVGALAGGFVRALRRIGWLARAIILVLGGFRCGVGGWRNRSSLGGSDGRNWCHYNWWTTVDCWCRYCLW
jgi:hypothetical protein